jgi:uncharacterized membrane protein YkvA (DUF1232 family)
LLACGARAWEYQLGCVSVSTEIDTALDSLAAAVGERKSGLGILHCMFLRNSLQVWARKVKRDGITLWFAGRHPATPWYAKALGLFVVAYALSPVDLIPDFIPVLCYLDDVLLLSGLILLTIRLLPPQRDITEKSFQKTARLAVCSRPIAPRMRFNRLVKVPHWHDEVEVLQELMNLVIGNWQVYLFGQSCAQ